MKTLKIIEKNAEAIESALHEVNGGKHTHTYTTYSEIADIATRAEMKLSNFIKGSKNRAGAAVVSTSGDAVSNSYGHSRTATVVTLERRGAGWYMVDALARGISQDGGGESLALTQEQDAEAVANFRKNYSLRAA